MMSDEKFNYAQSPLRKKARYNFDEIDNKSWSLTNNKVELNPIDDLGVGRLDNGENFSINYYEKIPQSPKSLAAQIAAMEASLPENTLEKLNAGELNHLLIQHTEEIECDNYNYFDILSDEVILCIFKKFTKPQLKEVALVCRRFKRLVEDESLWTRMDVSNEILQPGALGVIMSRQVIVLRLSKSKINHPPILSNVNAASPDYQSRLSYLDLSMAEISTQSLTMIFGKCKRLKALSLENVPVNEEVLQALADNKDIEIINFAMSTGIERNGLKYLLTNCRLIRELNMAWTYLDLPSINYICDNLPSTLSRFNFSGCRKMLEDKHIYNLIANCPNLTELDLSDCTSLTGETVRQITVLDDLNFLALSRCYLIPYKALLHLKKVKSLAFLDIHGGYIDSRELKMVKETLGERVTINKFMFSSVARPTFGLKRSSIWNMRVKD